MPRARTDETLKISTFIIGKNGEKKSFLFIFLKNARHFVIYAYVFKNAVCTLANVILNLKLFDFFVLDGPSPRFHPQRRHTYFLRSSVYLQL